MKKLISLILILTPFAACKKLSLDPGGPGIPVTPSPKIVTSVRIYDSTDHQLRIDSFVYDANDRLQNYLIITHDSSSTPQNDGIENIAFNYNGADSMPTYFTNGSDHHYLAYDSERRVTKDSVENLYTLNLSFGNNVVYTSLILPPAIGHYEDTILVQGNNVVSRNYWFFMPGNAYHTIYNFTYSSYANPLYNLKHLGLLLYSLRGKDLDFVSNNLYLSYTANGAFTNTASWVSAAETVSGGTESFVSAGVTHHQQVTFRYK